VHDQNQQKSQDNGNIGTHDEADTKQEHHDRIHGFVAASLLILLGFFIGGIVLFFLKSFRFLHFREKRLQLLCFAVQVFLDDVLRIPLGEGVKETYQLIHLSIELPTPVLVTLVTHSVPSFPPLSRYPD